MSIICPVTGDECQRLRVAELEKTLELAIDKDRLITYLERFESESLSRAETDPSKLGGVLQRPIRRSDTDIVLG